MTPNREDYLKLILELGGDKDKINNKQIVSGLNVSAASVSEMISKLVKEHLVEHSPYQGVQLTETGLQKAGDLVRKHRLWEVLLVEHLNYSWKDVNEEAEVLEHVTSETLADRLSDFLKQPEFCPHGGMVPKKNQLFHEKKWRTLADFPVKTHIRIARVLDEKELLDYLVSINLNINEDYTIKTIIPFEGPIIIQNNNKELSVSHKAANMIFVDPL